MKNPNPMRFDLVAKQVQWLAHFDAQRFRLIAARDSAAIVVRQHNDRHAL